MITPDTFIGTVAVLMGAGMAFSALMNTEAFSRFWLSRALESSCGSVVARGAGVAAGVIMAIIGLMLISGVLPLRKAGFDRATLVRQTGQMIYIGDQLAG